MAKPFEIYLPREIINKLEESNCLVKGQTKQVPADAFGGLNRTLSWINKCNCALLSGWRKDNQRKVNDENNRTILQVLRDKGYGVCRCRGYYPESGNKINVENSFFVIDLKHTGEEFFECVKTLAMSFNQNCFLFIEENGRKRFLYGTNDYFGNGRKEPLGPLHIGAMEGECFTKFGNKEMVFRSDDDS